eukprot:9472834-Pyramimonas_sp.AAC.1
MQSVPARSQSVLERSGTAAAPDALGIARTCAFFLRQRPSRSILDHLATKTTHATEKNTGNGRPSDA